jgi:hypothetical protein
MICIRDLLAKEQGAWSTYHTNKEEKFKIDWEKTGDTVKLHIADYAKILKYPEIALLHELLVHLIQEKIEWATNSTPKKVDNGINQPNPSRIPPINLSTSSTPPIAFPQKETPPPQNPPPQEEDISALLNTDVDYPLEEEEVAPDEKRTTNKSLPTSSQITAEPLQKLETSSIKNMRVDWYMHLTAEGKFVLLPGNIIEISPKAVRFQINQRNQIWIPKSVIKSPLPDAGADQLLVEKWWLEKNLEKVIV